MNQQSTCYAYDPNRFLDAVMQRLGVRSDKALSQKLQVARDVIAKIRSGCLPIGASMLLWIADITGASIAELRKLLGDRRVRARLNCALRRPARGVG